MSEYAEWQGGDLYYHAFYGMEQAYHQAMAAQPPDVRLAFRILRQMYDRAAFALSEKTRKSQERQFSEVRSLLYDSDHISFSWVPAVRAQQHENMNQAIDKLSNIQRELFDAMHEKKMLLPFGRTRRVGYDSIGPGGATYD